jgi:membrane glycosyltransferase
MYHGCLNRDLFYCFRNRDNIDIARTQCQTVLYRASDVRYHRDPLEKRARKKSISSEKETLFIKREIRFIYLWLALLVVDGAEFDFMFELVAMLPVLAPFEFVPIDVLPVLEVDIVVLVVATGAGVLAGIVLVLAGFVVLALFVAASPQAIPNAPNPRTAESAITFFICLQTPILSQRLIY